MRFQVRYLADDFGDPVIGVLFLNYNSANERYLGENASSLPVEGTDSLEMSVTWRENLREPAGCYKVTMAITYSSNVSSDNEVVIIDPELASFLTWWVVHDIEPQDVSLDECYPPQLGDTEMEQ